MPNPNRRPRPQDKPAPTPRDVAIASIVSRFETARQQRGVSPEEAGHLLDTVVLYLQSIGVEAPGFKPPRQLAARRRDDEESENNEEEAGA